MKLISILTAAALAGGGSAQAGVQRRATIVPVTEAPRDCPLTVSFASYAMGIDGTAFDKVRLLLMRDRGVIRIDQYRWGREGEVTLCARTRGRADSSRLFRAIRATLPKQLRGPVTVSMGRTRFTSPRR